MSGLVHAATADRAPTWRSTRLATPPNAPSASVVQISAGVHNRSIPTNASSEYAPYPPELCSRFHRASELIGRRWTGAIIFVLLKSRCRFATLRDAIPDITDRMLSERLYELEQEGIIERKVIPEPPVRVEYALTRKGRALASAMDAIAEWAHKWIPAEEPTPVATRRQRK
jgi:DNA-binding HxlR family transcriptional regulator